MGRIFFVVLSVFMLIAIPAKAQDNLGDVQNRIDQMEALISKLTGRVERPGI